MKFQLYTIPAIIFLALSQILQAQCPDGDIELTTQFELDLFTSKYPDCKELNGSLILDGNYIFAWERFPKIESVGGDLKVDRIREKEGIEKVLGSIKYVGGSVDIQSDQTKIEQGDFLKDQDIIHGYFLLNNFDFSEWDFSGIYTIENALNIHDCQGVTDLDVFQNLISVDRLFISKNADLEDIEGLNNLQGALGNIAIYQNPKLTLCNLPVLCESIAQDSTITVYDNASGSCQNITDIYENCGLEFEICKEFEISLQTQEEVDSFNFNYKTCLDSIQKLSITGDLITHLDSLYKISNVNEISIRASEIESLHGLEGIQALEILRISYSDKLKNLNGLENVEGLIELHLNQNGSLGNINSLNFERFNLDAVQLYNLPNLNGEILNCDTIAKRLFLINVPQTTIDLFGNVSFIEYLSVENCPLVIDLDPILDNASFIILRMSNCPNIENILFGPSNEHLNNIQINSNESLKSLKGLGNISNLRYFIVRENPLLEEISFPGISFIDYFHLRAANELKQIDIDQLDTINEVNISDNLILEDVSFLNNVKTSFESVQIARNPLLKNCNFQALCNFVDTLTNPDLLFLAGNDFGCDTENIGCVHSGNIYMNLFIDSQEDLDRIAQQYPEADSIFGAIQIQNFDGDLSFFEQIVYIDSSLTIRNASASLEPFRSCQIMNFRLYNYMGTDLPLFEGLQNMRALTLDDCQHIKNLESFSAIENIALSLNLRNLTNLESLDGLMDNIHLGSLYLDRLSIEDFTGLQHIEELNSLNIGDLEFITDLYDLNLLTKLDELYVTECSNLMDLFETNQFSEINTIYLRNNPVLQNLNGFEQIEDLVRLTILSNNALEEIEFLPMLSNNMEKNGTISIYDNSTIKEISFPSLKKLKTLYIQNNDNVEILDFPNDILIEERINIQYNENLSNCNYAWICSSLDSTEYVDIISNGVSCSNYAEILSGCGVESPRCPPGSISLSSIQTVEAYNSTYATCKIIPGILTVNIGLDSFAVKPTLDSLRLVKTLRVNEYYMQEDFALPQLEKIERDLIFQSSKFLKKIDLPVLESVAEVRITNNDKVTDLNWLPNVPFSLLDVQRNDLLESVSMEHDYGIYNFFRVENNPSLKKIGNEDWTFEVANLTIENNEVLMDIEDLKNIDLIYRLILSGNENLTDCAIESICKGLETSDFFTISENGPDCESNEEVIFICANPTSIIDEEILHIDVFPNPANTWIRIDCHSAELLRVEMISMEGRKVLISDASEINVEPLERGMYFLRVFTKMGDQTIKMIKL